MSEEKTAAISCRIPVKLKEELKAVVESGFWINESEFIREAVRTHVLGWMMRKEVESKEYDAKLGEIKNER